ncbi:hypothetical protein COM40_25115 [Bacillus wiedmannii]|nr:hypothetical protein COL51_16315 [Bacillus wiedmannii]PGC51499.1 hypothetical protein COM22_26845 [Bacillus wiedmannii]PGD52939.1 hypothetical protein COM40_25115 [Bacillus wiedmannii]PGD66672.1 hypothetical protein COM44_28635 [Bacillus wiedmannii]PHE68032.1 hypothetical protein COF77_30320 [Bacillus wiedmannii]
MVKRLKNSICKKKMSYTKSGLSFIFFTYSKSNSVLFKISKANVWFGMKLEKVYMKMADNNFVACQCQWTE